jgi:hypothetical protein
MHLRIVCCCMACAWLGGCSTQQLYAIGQQWQRNACQKIEERAERTRCEEGVAASYDSYQAQVESLKKP